MRWTLYQLILSLELKQRAIGHTHIPFLTDGQHVIVMTVHFGTIYSQFFRHKYAVITNLNLKIHKYFTKIRQNILIMTQTLVRVFLRMKQETFYAKRV
jgi:hypothetical protein